MEKALLILDLDETLIFGTRPELNYSSDFCVGSYFIYLRPNCIEFLKEASRWYKLSIWSSAGEDYVNGIAKYFIEQGFSFEFIWNRNRATYKRTKFQEINYINSESTHHFYIKRLSKVKKLGYDLNRMLIVDDTPHKSSENYGNAIYPEAFMGNQDDNELIQLIKYLIKIKDIKNYRILEKRFWKTEIQ